MFDERDWKKVRVVEDPRLLRMAVSLSPEPYPHHAWTRIGEGYSVRLASELLSRCERTPQAVLDPFAGTGPSLIAGARSGCSGTGVEVMPMGALKFEWMQSWKDLDLEHLAKLADLIGEMGVLHDAPGEIDVDEIISSSLRPGDIAQALGLRSFIESVASFPEKGLLQAAGLLAIRDQRRDLTDIGRVRRDGKELFKRISRPKYFDLDLALNMRFVNMLVELIRLAERNDYDDLSSQRMIAGSALEVLPSMQAGSFDAVISSPPYFNGFDYATEYALDHWFLGLEEEMHDVVSSFIPTNDLAPENREHLIEQYLLHGHRATVDEAAEALQDLELDLPLVFAREGLEPSAAMSMETYLLSLTLSLYEIDRLLERGGSAFFVIDDAPIGRLDVPVGRILSELGSNIGIEVRAIHRYGNKKDLSISRLAQERQRTCICQWVKV